MSGKTLTRADLAEAVFQKVGLPRNESAEIVELVLREIVASLERGQTVRWARVAVVVGLVAFVVGVAVGRVWRRHQPASPRAEPLSWPTDLN